MCIVSGVAITRKETQMRDRTILLILVTLVLFNWWARVWLN